MEFGQGFTYTTPAGGGGKVMAEATADAPGSS
jgi:hypothetical protein